MRSSSARSNDLDSHDTSGASPGRQHGIDDLSSQMSPLSPGRGLDDRDERRALASVRKYLDSSNLLSKLFVY